MINIIMFALLAKEWQEELSEVSFISVVLEGSNGNHANLNDGSILFSPNLWKQSRAFRG